MEDHLNVRYELCYNIGGEWRVKGMQRGTFQWMKSVNKTLILNKIRTSAPISRSEIAKETKLTPPTVSSNVKELIDEGLVIESELGESKGGRKPTMLLINQEAYYVVGVDVSPEEIKCGFVDLSGDILKRSSIPLSLPLTKEKFLKALIEGIDQVLRQVSREKNEKLIGIGVAMHGVVDVEKGISLFAPNLSLTDIPIKEVLEKKYPVEVKVENDARAIALGEFLFGDHNDAQSMLVLNVGRGIGAGFMIQDELYHGAQDLAGEVGHMMIDLNGDVCECGNRGCFQTMATGDAIAKRAKERLKGDFPIDGSGETVYTFAEEGNTVCKEILTETGHLIGIGLTNLIHILNPDKIILCGGVMNARKYLLPAILDTIQKHALTEKAKETTVEITSFGDEITVLGAVSLLLNDLFNPEFSEEE